MEVTRVGLSGDYVSDTSAFVQDAVSRTLGGVLLVADAHIPGARQERDRQALRLLGEATGEHCCGNLVVILARPARTGHPTPA